MPRPKTRTTRDFWLLFGGALIERMTEASEAINRDRSAWAETILARAVSTGLRAKLSTDLLIEAGRRKRKILLRVDVALAKKVIDRAKELEISLTDFVLFAMIGEL